MYVVERFVEIFAEAGIKLHLVHIVLRNIRITGTGLLQGFHMTLIQEA